ncbi:MAG: hypothetical protein JSS62_04740 [Verrucomicrobia bacterium]|nr:hypothetical protein [Verrucomicrobiota bacterium]MBS0645750.1 hypothetical protein [Verrucomicrobiota bacterium]
MHQGWWTLGHPFLNRSFSLAAATVGGGVILITLAMNIFRPKYSESLTERDHHSSRVVQPALVPDAAKRRASDANT